HLNPHSFPTRRSSDLRRGLESFARTGEAISLLEVTEPCRSAVTKAYHITVTEPRRSAVTELAKPRSLSPVEVPSSVKLVAESIERIFIKNGFDRLNHRKELI